MPRITAEHHTCVGLALELWNRLRYALERKYPCIGNHLCVVSCEEDLENIPIYMRHNIQESNCYRFEKEHVLMCLKVNFNGRTGILVCDPGYHVARIVTIMFDGAYPTTGRLKYSLMVSD